ncbi:hypothetical protein HME9302_00492 [Alteripontixanthobacter maritimus]|uniref:Lipoprotein n=1 Tax=Alteripontixanthobacter maritimus TaxID=2161824 RepID=A0A369Q6Y0_9SPHN|nr:hypothetical protein [Alteripontixanthobacter maritimus]RDC59305.1 hypothetical protein HME9302_00492 [Alteripontixanthobacter maritimus]
MNAIKRIATLSLLSGAAALGGCAQDGQLVLSDGVGITSVRGVCPAVGVPDYTGDITTFRTPGSTLATDMDVTASITNVRSTCDDSSAKVYTNATFDVQARRFDTRGARQVQLPFFSTVLRGGSTVVSKRVGTVTVNFADGAERATASAQAGAFIDRAAATLPDDVRRQITRRRKAGDADAALDPLADPQVKAALDRANFEVLVGFQLTRDQLAYNATR